MSSVVTSVKTDTMFIKSIHPAGSRHQRRDGQESESHSINGAACESIAPEIFRFRDNAFVNSFQGYLLLIIRFLGVSHRIFPGYVQF